VTAWKLRRTGEGAKNVQRERHATGVIAIVMPFALDPNGGGVQRVTWQLGHYLGRRGWSVLFVSLAAAGHTQPITGLLEHPRETLGQSSAGIEGFLRSVVTRHRPAIVVNQLALSGCIARSLWRLSDAGQRFAVVGCYHNNPALYRSSLRHILRHRFRTFAAVRFLVDNPVMRALLVAAHRIKGSMAFMAAYSRCSRLVLLSLNYFDELKWFVPSAQAHRLDAIPNGFPVQDPPSPETKRNVLLFVGRVNNLQKNVFALPLLWARLHARLADWELHVVGDGEDRRELEGRFAALGLPRVVLHGHQEPTPHYREAKIFLMTSAYEGFGNTLVEAQMQGVVPVVFETYSALRDILNDRVDAAIVPWQDLDAFEARILELAEDPVLLAQASGAAVINSKRFSEDAVGRRWEALFAKMGVLAPGAAGPTVAASRLMP
jgi:glycosyltransferase involved in cell wall biosynthesis